MTQEPEGMNWLHRFSAMGIGGIASLFALGWSKPETHSEALFRFASGCVCAFAFTGFVLSMLHIAINIDSVLACGLVCGSCGWWLMGGVVNAAKNGTILAWLAAWFTKSKPPEGK